MKEQHSNQTINVLMMTLIFPPDGVSSAQLLGEIVEDLKIDGLLNINVITTSPHYNSDELARLAQPIKWRWYWLCGTSDYCGAKVWHIRMPQKAKSAVLRSLQWLWFHLCSLVLAASMSRKADILITVSPPPTITVVAAILKTIFRLPFVYVMWELYPKILVTLGHVTEGSMFHRLLVWLEKYTYEKADRIVTLHAPMKEAVVSLCPEASDKVVVIPTFADVSYLVPMDKETSLRDQYGLNGKFVVGYAGNLGSSEDLGIVLEAAVQLPEIFFLICGDGTERARLEAFAIKHSLNNVIFTGHLPYEMVPEITATADVSLVVLSEGVGDEALPSKVYKVMACGRPVLAISSAGSPLAELVESLDVGVVVDDYLAVTLVDAIKRMKEDDKGLIRTSANARAAAVEKFSRNAVTEEYRKMIVGVVAA